MIEFNWLALCNECPNFKAETILKEPPKGIIPTVPTFTVRCENYSLCKKWDEMYREKDGIERRGL